MLNRRAQSGIELVTYFSIGILITIAFFVAIGPYEQAVLQQRQELLAKDVLWRVAAEINGAAIVGPGYERNVNLPPMLRDGTAYTIEVDSQTQKVEIYWGGGSAVVVMPIITSNITGTFVPGANRMSNSGGMITIEAA